MVITQTTARPSPTGKAVDLSTCSTVIITGVDRPTIMACSSSIAEHRPLIAVTSSRAFPRSLLTAQEDACLPRGNHGSCHQHSPTPDSFFMPFVGFGHGEPGFQRIVQARDQRDALRTENPGSDIGELPGRQCALGAVLGANNVCQHRL